MFLKPFFFIVTLAFSVGVSAEVQFCDTRVWRRAKLVADGQHVWSFQSSYRKVRERFSASGDSEALGRRYDRAVTWKQLLDAESLPEAKADMRAYMRRNSLSESDVAASSGYQMEREDLGLAVDWAYGLTARWMIGFQLPMVYRRTRIKSQVEMQPALIRGAGQSSQRSALALSSEALRERVKALAQDELANSGYDEIPDQKNSFDWGDVSVMSQFALLDHQNWTWSVQQMVRFPTAQNPDVADYFQSGGDDGQVDLGLTSLLDYRVHRWTLGLRLGYVAQMPDLIKMRAPEGGVEPDVRRDLGDWAWAALDGEYRLDRRWDLSLGYSYLVKDRDRYGTKAFDRVAAESGQSLHETRMGVLFELGEYATRSGIDNRWVAALNYSYPWIGQNSTQASRTSLELTSYF
ncbi:MAG: hypothetical protein HC902_04055 [Calothrix sp. SM1_5_4]|nr:hypothetical protein [Calothrix sp. SM1_5_4]